MAAGAGTPLDGEIRALRLILSRVIALDALEGEPREVAQTVTRLVDGYRARRARATRPGGRQRRRAQGAGRLGVGGVGDGSRLMQTLERESQARRIQALGRAPVDLAPSSTYEALTRQMVEHVAADVAAIRERVDMLFYGSSRRWPLRCCCGWRGMSAVDVGLRAAVRLALTDVEAFSHAALPGLTLRGYQTPLARALAESIALGDDREYAAALQPPVGQGWRTAGAAMRVATLPATAAGWDDHCRLRRRCGRRGC